MSKLAKHLNKLANEVEHGEKVELAPDANDLHQARMAAMLHEWADTVESSEE